MSEQERLEQCERICQKLSALTEEQYQEFMDTLKVEHEAIWLALFVDLQEQ